MERRPEDPQSLTAQFLKEIQQEFPKFRVVKKKGDALSWLIDRALKTATLGAQSEYLTHYHTVIGYTLYVPNAWDSTPDVSRVITLRHERVHLRQFRKYTAVGMAFVYMVPFFPVGLAYGRARIEWEAYTETLRATADYKGIDAAKQPWLKEHIIKQFTSGAYGWMWPFRGQLERWYADAIATIENEQKKR